MSEYPHLKVCKLSSFGGVDALRNARIKLSIFDAGRVESSGYGVPFRGIDRLTVLVQCDANDRQLKSTAQCFPSHPHD